MGQSKSSEVPAYNQDDHNPNGCYEYVDYNSAVNCLLNKLIAAAKKQPCDEGVKYAVEFNRQTFSAIGYDEKCALINLKQTIKNYIIWLITEDEFVKESKNWKYFYAKRVDPFIDCSIIKNQMIICFGRASDKESARKFAASEAIVIMLTKIETEKSKENIYNTTRKDNKTATFSENQQPSSSFNADKSWSASNFISPNKNLNVGTATATTMPPTVQISGRNSPHPSASNQTNKPHNLNHIKVSDQSPPSEEFLRQQLDVKFVKKNGSDFAPNFTYVAIFGERRFLGFGRSETDAKKNATDQAIKILTEESKNPTLNQQHNDISLKTIVEYLWRDIDYKFTGCSMGQGGEIFRTFSATVYSQVFSFECHNGQLAKDAVQEILLKHFSKKTEKEWHDIIKNFKCNLKFPETGIILCKISVNGKNTLGRSWDIWTAKKQAIAKALLSMFPLTNDVHKANVGKSENKNLVSPTAEFFRQQLHVKLVRKEGPNHAPIFTFEAQYGGRRFLGRGRSKKEAEKNAADEAIKVLMEVYADSAQKKAAKPYVSKVNLKTVLGYLNSVIDYKLINRTRGSGGNAVVKYSATVCGQSFTAEGCDKTSVQNILRGKFKDYFSRISEIDFIEKSKKFKYTFDSQASYKSCTIEINGKQFIGRSCDKFIAEKQATAKAVMWLFPLAAKKKKSFDNNTTFVESPNSIQNSISSSSNINTSVDKLSSDSNDKSASCSHVENTAEKRKENTKTNLSNSQPPNISFDTGVSCSLPNLSVFVAEKPADSSNAPVAQEDSAVSEKPTELGSLDVKLVKEEGADHAPIFTLGAQRGEKGFLGPGRSENEAEKNAADEAIKPLMAESTDSAQNKAANPHVSKVNLTTVVEYLNSVVDYKLINRTKGFGGVTVVKYSATVYEQSVTAEGPDTITVQNILREKIQNYFSKISDKEFIEKRSNFKYTFESQDAYNICRIEVNEKQFIGFGLDEFAAEKHATAQAVMWLFPLVADENKSMDKNTALVESPESINPPSNTNTSVDKSSSDCNDKSTENIEAKRQDNTSANLSNSQPPNAGASSSSHPNQAVFLSEKPTDPPIVHVSNGNSTHLTPATASKRCDQYQKENNENVKSVSLDDTWKKSDQNRPTPDTEAHVLLTNLNTCKRHVDNACSALNRFLEPFNTSNVEHISEVMIDLIDFKDHLNVVEESLKVWVQAIDLAEKVNGEDENELLVEIKSHRQVSIDAFEYLKQLRQLIRDCGQNRPKESDETTLANIKEYVNSITRYEFIGAKESEGGETVDYSATVCGHIFTAKGPSETFVRNELRKKINKQLANITESEFNELVDKFVYTYDDGISSDGFHFYDCTVNFNGKKYVGSSTSKDNAKKKSKRLAIATALMAITHSRVQNSIAQKETPSYKQCTVENINSDSTVSTDIVVDLNVAIDNSNAIFAFDSVARATGANVNVTFENSVQQFEKKNESKESINSTCPSPNDRNAIFKDHGQEETKIDQFPVGVMYTRLQHVDPNMQIFVNYFNDKLKNFQFIAFVLFNGETFHGFGRSKQTAKDAALNSAFTKVNNTSVASLMLKHNVAKHNQNESLPQQLVDYIGHLVRQKYKNFDLDCKRRNVIAGIVQTDGYSKATTKLIAVTTGTKCINGKHLDLHGEVVKDMHAEIVARRCLLYYLYEQLETIRKNGNCSTSIFQCRHSKSKYKLKPNIKFHLFISKVPCGDAAVFYRPDREKPCGHLRMKIESQDGSSPIKSNQTEQTWDGIMQGTPLMIMSCSDKICKWNVVGVQGALLSTLIEPIYFDNIIIGTPSKLSALQRGLYERIGLISTKLTAPFKLNKPFIHFLTSGEERTASFTPECSFNWIVGLSKTEKLNSTTGRVEQKTSRVCTKNFVDKYVKINANARGNTYENLKESAAEYQRVKKLMFSTFKDKGLNNWIKMPIELNEFEIF